MATLAIDDDTTVMQRYGIHPVRGFLPAEDPLQRLPAEYAAWEELGEALPALLAAGRAREAVAALPLLDPRSLATEAEWERAMLLLSYFGHAYVFAAPPVSRHIPAPVAVPWHAVAEQVRRPPVLTYASYILRNWRRLDPAGPIALENLARPQHFLGGMDEDWFGMIHIAIEAQAGPGLYALLVAQDGVAAGDVALVTAQLGILAQSIVDMLAVLNRTPEKCDPYIYYNRVRPYLSGWQDNPALPDGMLYDGVAAYNGQPQFFRGGSGAQSAIIPAIDDALGLVFDDNPFGRYMRSLREYMPPPHRAFIELMRQRHAIRAFVKRRARSEPALVAAYNHCLEVSVAFRQDHFKYAARYIHAQSQRDPANSTEIGTSGTPFMAFLRQHVSEVRQHLITKK
jgi:indoleamine 2,3-dioxygenase